jgi:hypothetical protein
VTPQTAKMKMRRVGVCYEVGPSPDLLAHRTCRHIRLAGTSDLPAHQTSFFGKGHQ